MQIVLVTFVGGSWAQQWLEETRVPFPLLHDADGELYQMFGFGRSVARVWGPEVLLDYAKRLLRGERLRAIRGSPHQLGGDVLLDANRRIRYLHRSQSPVDRPTINALLQAVASLSGSDAL